MSEAITQILFVLLVFAIAYWFVSRPAKVSWGKVSTLLGSLDYEFGNDISDQNGTNFRGIEVTIPKRFPHIYIDGHETDSLMAGPRYMFDKSSKLSLEGDFDRHFQVYAAQEYKSLALSILQPDIMQSLVDHFGSFDVEIYHDKIRIITKQKVFGNQEQQFLLADVATKLVNELQRRISVWKEYDESTAGVTDLPYTPDTATKIGRRSIASLTILTGLFVGAIALMIVGGGLWLDYGQQPRDHEQAVAMYKLALVIFPGLWLVIIALKKVGVIGFLARHMK